MGEIRTHASTMLSPDRSSSLCSTDPQNVRAALADANKVLASSAPEAEKEEARIEVDVFEGLQAALSK